MPSTACSATGILLLGGLAACQQQPAETTALPPSLRAGASTAAQSPADAPPPARVTGLPASVAAAAPQPTGRVALPFSNRLAGCWLSVAYLAAVRRTRSPMRAGEEAPDGLVALYVAQVPPAADSTGVDAVLNFHETAPATLYLPPSATTFPLQFEGSAEDAYYEAAFRATATDTVLVVVKADNRSQRPLRRYAFRRVAGAAPDARRAGEALVGGIATALRRRLVAGTYAGSDSAGHRLHPRFLPGGQVTGLPFRTYEVAADYISPGAGDELIFDNDTPRRRELAVTFGRDTLRIYTILSDSTERYWRGRLRYQLVRVSQP